MRMLSSAGISVIYSSTTLAVLTIIVTGVAFGNLHPVALKISRCVRTAATWLNPYAKASVTLASLTLRIRTVCRVRMGPKSAYSVRQDAMATRTVMALGLIRAGMSRIVLFFTQAGLSNLIL